MTKTRKIINIICFIFGILWLLLAIIMTLALEEDKIVALLVFGGLSAINFYVAKNYIVSIFTKEKANQTIEKWSEKIKNEYQENLNSKTIKKVVIIGNETDSRKKAGSSILRGAVGGYALGTAGLVGGALSGKNKTTSKTTFLIEYADGHRETKTVKNNSKEFKNLCNYIKME